MIRAAIGVLGLGVGLGCAGLGAPEVAPEPPPPEAPPPAPAGAAWVEAAVARAVEAETLPGTAPDDSPEAHARLRAFFVAHPEYEDPASLDALLADACDGVEGTHERLRNPPPKTPVVVEVDRDDWRVVVVHADSRCTSDDWSWFTHEVGQQLDGDGIPHVYAGADNDGVVVKRGGAEAARVPLAGQGYLALRAGAEPVDVPHDQVEAVIEQLRAAWTR